MEERPTESRGVPPKSGYTLAPRSGGARRLRPRPRRRPAPDASSPLAPIGWLPCVRTSRRGAGHPRGCLWGLCRKSPGPPPPLSCGLCPSAASSGCRRSAGLRVAARTPASQPSRSSGPGPGAERGLEDGAGAPRRPGVSVRTPVAAPLARAGPSAARRCSRPLPRALLLPHASAGL